jgi:hypothetical protein
MSLAKVEEWKTAYDRWLFAGLHKLTLNHSFPASAELLQCIGTLSNLSVLHIGERPKPRILPCLQRNF